MTKPNTGIKPNTKYTFVIEFRNVKSVNSNVGFRPASCEAVYQVCNSTTINGSQMKNGARIVLKSTSVASFTSPSVSNVGIRPYFYIYAGNNVDLEMKMTVYEGWSVQ